MTPNILFPLLDLPGWGSRQEQFGIQLVPTVTSLGINKEGEDRKSPLGKQGPGGWGCVPMLMASSQNTMKRQKRWETPTPYRAGGYQSWGRENRAPDSVFLFFPSTFQASQARTNEAEQGWEAGANLTCRNQEELPKAAQPEKSRGDGEGDETPLQTCPHQAHCLGFPPQMQKHSETFGPV